MKPLREHALKLYFLNFSLKEWFAVCVVSAVVMGVSVFVMDTALMWPEDWAARDVARFINAWIILLALVFPIGIIGLSGLICILLAEPALSLVFRSMNVRWERRVKAASVLVGFLILTLAGFSVGSRGAFLFRMHQIAKVPERAVPIVVSLDQYYDTHGVYPESLLDLVPTYLPEIPGTGLAGYPKFRYKLTQGSFFSIPVDAGTHPYQLWTDSGLTPLHFDDFFYWPNRSEKALSGMDELEPMGEWGDFHD